MCLTKTYVLNRHIKGLGPTPIPFSELWIICC
uniref:Uncharacterized protein n=1 Tax=Arundo donax TaxID=35708 RepID=A0A0A8YCH0_ARUDO